MTRARRRIDWWKLILILVSIAAILSAIVVARSVSYDGDQTKETLMLPQIEMMLGGTSLAEINAGAKTVKYTGNSLVLQMPGEEDQYFDGVEIKGRGNSTWGYKKKPYQIKLSQKTDFAGLGKGKKWILLANAYDDSEIRNDLALHLAEMLEMQFAVRGRFVKLTIDQEDLGLYYLTNKIEIGKDSVDLRDELGILVEFDNLHAAESDRYAVSTRGDFLVVKDLVNDDDNYVSALHSFMNDYNALEVAVERRDFAATEELIDVESWAKYFLLSEFTVNPDAYVSSWYLYKDGQADKIHAGPGWDFDFALGNHQWVWADDENFYDPTIDFEERYKIDPKTEKRVMFGLASMPEFQEIVKDLFQKYWSGRKDEVADYLRAQIIAIKQEATWDHQMWEMGDFDAEAGYLFNWVMRRYGHLEWKYGDSSRDLMREVQMI